MKKVSEEFPENFMCGGDIAANQDEGAYNGSKFIYGEFQLLLLLF